MDIHVTVDDARWDAALDNLLVALLDATREATQAAGEELQALTRAKLNEKSHRWPFFSNAAWGEPPARVSGDLSDSIDVQMFGDEAWVGPTAGFGRSGEYARIQELGGEMHGHPLMRFWKVGPAGLQEYTREFVQLYPRPYLEPATEDLIDSGRLTEIYIEHWAPVLEGRG